LNKARTDTPQECPATAVPRTFMPFVLPYFCTGHFEDNADKGNVKNPNILLYIS
jgi:hypothetical protein